MTTFAALLTTAPEAVHQTYDQMREADDGIHVDAPTGMTFVTRYADASRILKNSKGYSNKVLLPPTPVLAHDTQDPAQRRAVEHILRFPQFVDPPTHTRLRNLARHTFTPRSINRLKDAIDVVTTEIFTELDNGQELDFVDVAEKLPVWVIAHAMGFPLEDRQLLRRWSIDLASTLDPAVVGDHRRDCLRGTDELIAYLHDLVTHRRRAPGDDLISTLIAAEGGGDLDDATELVGIIVALLGAGNVTTADLLTGGMKLFIDHPDQYAALCDEHDLVRSAIEEVLRFEPSLKWTGRVVTTPDRVGAHDLYPGAFVWVGLAAANRDPRRFDDAGCFDIRRSDNQHLTFGSGIHYCIGAPLARLEADVFFSHMIERFPRLPELTGEPTFAVDFIARSIRRFPIRLM